MIFEWDYNKAKENEAKHGISFEIAEHVFSSNMIAKEDTRQDYQEKRYTAFSLYFGRCINIIYRNIPYIDTSKLYNYYT